MLGLFYCGLFYVFIHLVSGRHAAKSVTFQPMKHTKANQNKMWIQAGTGEAFRVKNNNKKDKKRRRTDKRDFIEV